MTDKTKYSNISVSKDTYSSLQKLSKEILPDASLSISKTVTYLVNCKIKESNEYLRSEGYQTEEIGFKKKKKIINWVINNTTNKGDKNGKK